MAKRSGRCLCGAVQFEVGEMESHYHACHCAMCRRWSGGAPFFSVECRDVELPSTAALGRYRSSSWAERGFCRECGSTLFYWFRPADSYAVSIGCFDDVEDLELSREIFIDRKPKSYALAGDHERWTEAETFERLTPPDEA
jgi:hypothetical protein